MVLKQWLLDLGSQIHGSVICSRYIRSGSILIFVVCVVSVVVCDEVNDEDAAHQVDKADEALQVHPLDPVHQHTR